MTYRDWAAEDFGGYEDDQLAMVRERIWLKVYIPVATALGAQEQLRYAGDDARVQIMGKAVIAADAAVRAFMLAARGE